MSGHKSVLLEESVQALPVDGKVFVDGTLGGGGHSEAILQRTSGLLIAIDKDQDAIVRCEQRLAPYADRVRFFREDFKAIKEIVAQAGLGPVDGAVLDLGVSSFQLDEEQRGFSYSKKAPLDMRMDRSAELSAYEVVNAYPRDKLVKILYEYGEEKFAGRIVTAIVKSRPIEDTLTLSEIVRSAIPAAARRSGGHPAKRTFQAIRIEVNGELIGLSDTISDFIDVLAPGGVLAVISFHSLEDRAVKRAFQKAEHPCTCPPDFPKCVCGKEPLGRMVTRKPILPGERELAENSRAHSAKLRIFEKIR